jgi:hypothetical protein
MRESFGETEGHEKNVVCRCKLGVPTGIRTPVASVKGSNSC